MKLTISENEYKKYKTNYRIGMPILVFGAISGQLAIGYWGGIAVMLFGFGVFVHGLLGLNKLFVCPHCQAKMITNAKKDFKKGKTPDTCPVCKKKVVIELE